MPVSTLRVLGDFVLEPAGCGGPVWLGRKGQAMLAYVAMQGGKGASRGRLVDLLWADHSESDARNALRQCLHLVRRELGAAAEGLDSHGDRLVLRDAGFDVDVRRFESLAARTDVESMLAAAQLYRGDFVSGLEAGVEFANWAGGERDRLRDIAHGLVARLSERAAGKTASEATIRLAHSLLANDPLHEGCYRALMRLHARAGLRAKALQTWNECRRVLRQELGVEPSAETAALIEQLCTADGAALDGDTRVPALPPGSMPSAMLLQGHGTADPAVVDLLLRGWQFFTLSTAENNAKARAAFQAAVERAPDHAEALARLGWTYWMGSVSGWDADPVMSNEQAYHWGSRAVACNRGHPTPHTLMGKVLLWRMEYEAALEHLKRALEIAPGFAYAHFHLGEAAMWSGRSDEAVAYLARALELDPNDHGMFLTIRGMAQWIKGDLREANASLASAITRNPDYAWAHSALVAVHVERGDIEAARDSRAIARRLNRRFSLSFAEHVMPFARPDHRRRKVDAWRIAGMPPLEGAMSQDRAMA